MGGKRSISCVLGNNNPKAIKKVFRRTVEIARNFDLIGGLLIAGDGTRMRAQNSRKNNYNYDFLEYFLRSSPILKQIFIEKTVMAQPNLSLYQVSNLKIINWN